MDEKGEKKRHSIQGKRKEFRSGAIRRRLSAAPVCETSRELRCLRNVERDSPEPVRQAIRREGHPSGIRNRLRRFVPRTAGRGVDTLPSAEVWRNAPWFGSTPSIPHKGRRRNAWRESPRSSRRTLRTAAALSSRQGESEDGDGTCRGEDDASRMAKSASVQIRNWLFGDCRRSRTKAARTFSAAPVPTPRAGGFPTKAMGGNTSPRSCDRRPRRRVRAERYPTSDLPSQITQICFVPAMLCAFPSYSMGYGTPE